MKTCPFCAEPIQDAAVKCRYCGSLLTGAERDAPVCLGQVRHLLSQGRRDEAVTLLTTETGWDAPNAAAYVDQLGASAPAAVPPRRSGCLGLVVLAVVAGFAIAFFASRNATTPRPIDPAVQAQAEQVVEAALRAGLIVRVDVARSRVMMSPAGWQALDIDQKRGLGSACGTYLRARGRDGFVFFYDQQSGRKLAAWGLGHLDLK